MSSLLAPVLLVALTATEPTASARADLDALLARPVSPGTIALLVSHLPETRAAERVIASLIHQNPAVRAAAARVVYVSGLSGAAAAVRTALEAETDRSAAVEQLRAATLSVPTGGEPALRAIAERHGLVPQLARAMGTATPAHPAALGWRSPDEYARIMIAGGLPPGMLRDILAVTGCKADPDLRAPSIVVYRPDGRPRQVSIAAKLLSPGCAEAAGPALGLTLAPSGFLDPAQPDRKAIVIIPLNEDALECADQPEASAIEPVPDGDKKARIKQPRKIKNAPPQYPMAAREARRQGTVVLEAILTESGCVRSARVVQGVAPDLDLAAMISVNQWRYTPTLLDGKPVSVVMTATVAFRLH